MLCMCFEIISSAMYIPRNNTVSGNTRVHLLRKSDNSTDAMILRLVIKLALFVTKGEILNCVMLWKNIKLLKRVLKT